MKTINAKRIAAVAASLLMGLAFAGTGGVTWSNIPIINNQGQPVVQVVVGSTAQPSDGVVAANIAAVLGNLAFTSINVTGQVGNTAGVHCVVTTPTCSLTNQQVWFNEKGFSAPSGTYAFTALIGSVLNGAVQAGAPAQTKSLQTSSAYTYPETSPIAISISPVSSPFTTGPNVNHPVNGNNGGGLTFSSFTKSGQDNILQIGPSQLPALPNNWGANGQTNYLWLTGFPVYDQQTGTNPTTPNLAVASFGGAYQAVWNKPIQEPWVAKGNTINNAAIRFLGQNWTILNYTTPLSNSASTSNAIVGGTLSLATTLTPIQTIYVGHNISSGGFTVALTDLGQPNSAGVSQASVNVYYNGTLTNTTQLSQATTTKFQVGAHSIFVKVNQTFAGLYAYQKWAKMQLYSNVMYITSGSVLNTTNANGWNAYIYWSNTTKASSGRSNALQSLVIVNNSAGIVTPGGSLVFVTPNMTAYKATFVGDTLGTNYDPVTFTTSLQSGMTYQNQGSNPGTAGLGNINNITNQPGQILTVTSQIPTAFTAPGIGPATQTLTYDLEPYMLNIDANTIGKFASGAVTSAPINILISSTIGDANIIKPASPLTVYVLGYATSTSSGPTTASVQVATLGSNTLNGVSVTTLPASNVLSLGANFFNITNVYLSQALPYISVNVIASQSANVVSNNALADLETTATPQLLFKNSNHVWQQLTSGTQATYNQQNGQTAYQNGFTITTQTPGPTAAAKQYFVYAVNEYDVPSSTTTNDLLEFGIYNSSSAGSQNWQFVLNQSVAGTKNNMTYVPSAGSSVSAPLGFITERGSKVASISTGSVTINYAKVVDTLQFLVGPVAGVTGSNTVLSSTVGPVGVGQAVPGFANLTVSKVNATCAFTSTSCNVVGLSNLTASSSQGNAVVPVQLNTANQPIAVLDGNANSASTLIVVGSKYVNTVAQQIFAQNPSLNSSFGPSSVVVSAEGQNRILVAGYTANQTVQAGNQFINALLQAAGTP